MKVDGITLLQMIKDGKVKDNQKIICNSISMFFDKEYKVIRYENGKAEIGNSWLTNETFEIIEEEPSKNDTGLEKNFTGMAWFKDGKVVMSILCDDEEPKQLPEKIDYTRLSTQKEKNKILKDTTNQLIDYLKYKESDK